MQMSLVFNSPVKVTFRVLKHKSKTYIFFALMVRCKKELEMTKILNSIDLDIVKALLARAPRTQ